MEIYHLIININNKKDIYKLKNKDNSWEINKFGKKNIFFTKYNNSNYTKTINIAYCLDNGNNFKFTDYANKLKLKINNNKYITKIEVIYTIEKFRNHAYMKALEKIYNINYISDIDIIKKTEYKVFLWSYIINKDTVEYDIWNYRKRNYLKTYCLERGVLPNTINIDNTGWYFDSLYYKEKFWNYKLDNNKKIKVKEYINKFINSNITLEVQGNKNINNLNIDYKNYYKIISIFLQLDEDQVIKFGMTWLKDNQEFKNYIIELSKKNKDILFLVKNHPLSNGKITKTTYFNYISNNVILVDDYNYKDIIKISDKVLTINSSVGLQSMMFKKECGILGKTFYNIKGINKILNSDIEVNNFIRNKNKLIDIEKVERFISYLLKIYIKSILIKKKKNLYENTTDKVIILDNNTHIDNRKKIVIVLNNDINNKLNEKIRELECIYEISVYNIVKDIDYKKINKLYPDIILFSTATLMDKNKLSCDNIINIDLFN